MTVAGSRHLLALGIETSDGGGKRGEHTILHGDIDDRALTGCSSAKKGGHNCRIKMGPRDKVGKRGSGFEWRAAFFAGDTHDTADGLERDVHAQVVSVGSVGIAVASAGGIN